VPGRRRGAGAALPLARLERWLQGEIVRPHEGGRPPALGARAVVRPSATLAPKERVAIYSRMYFTRLHDCLAEDFPAVRALLGEARFERLARRYLARFPSRHYSLNALGRALPRFLAGPVRIPRRALVRDVARVEAAMAEVFDAEDARPLGAADLAAVPASRWEAARLRPVPGLRLLALDHPVNPLVTAARGGEPSPAVPRRRAFTAVYRKDFAVWRADLGEPAFAALGALARGATIGRALAAAARVFEGEPAALEGEVQRWFRGWIEDGLFAAVELAPPAKRRERRRP
jgi:hypothetical protein